MEVYLSKSVKWICLLSLLIHSSFHAIYISVIEIKEEKNNSEMMIKVFSDDLQNAIRNYSTTYRHGTLKDFAETNKALIEAYFNDKIVLSINDKSREFEIQEIRIENDAHFLTFSFPTENDWKEFEIKTTFFTELFPDQSNILTLNSRGKKYFYRLTKERSTYEVVMGEQ